jgi:hypothetical protein
MALDVECVVDGGVNGQETLGGSGRFETLHLALAPSCRLMRILGPIVCAQALVMASRQSNFGLRRAVRAQVVRYQHLGGFVTPTVAGVSFVSKMADGDIFRSPPIPA